MDDFLKMCLLVIIVVTCILGIVYLAFTASKAIDRSRLRDMKENKTSVIINGENIALADVSMLSVTNGQLDVEMKDGKKITTGNFTIITPPQSTIEK